MFLFQTNNKSGKEVVLISPQLEKQMLNNAVTLKDTEINEKLAVYLQGEKFPSVKQSLIKESVHRAYYSYYDVELSKLPSKGSAFVRELTEWEKNTMDPQTKLNTIKTIKKESPVVVFYSGTSVVDIGNFAHPDWLKNSSPQNSPINHTDAKATYFCLENTCGASVNHVRALGNLVGIENLEGVNVKLTLKNGKTIEGECGTMEGGPNNKQLLLKVKTAKGTEKVPDSEIVIIFYHSKNLDRDVTVKTTNYEEKIPLPKN
ncbi:MAG: hypothetical protein NTX79_08610 [Candidatus Micrarchaeota archaeon]|nr:hypothetical protein [Candidatus Micrarchaeota archaeon]